MTRATLRQHGPGLLWALVLIAFVSAILAVTGWRFLGDAGPQPHWIVWVYPWLTWNVYLRVMWGGIAILVGQQLIGPDLAAGTITFAWSQGMTRRRWLGGKLLTTAAVLGSTALGFGLLYQWWFRGYSRFVGPWPGFDLYAPALAGWTVAGLALGMCAAALIRRPVRALAAACIAYWALDWLVGKLQPHHVPLLDGGPNGSGWAIRPHVVPSAGLWVSQLAILGLLLMTAAALIAATLRLTSGLDHQAPWPVSRRSHRDTLLVLAPARFKWPMLAATWRQHRTVLLAVGTIVVTAAALLIVSGIRLHAELAGSRYLGHPQMRSNLSVVLSSRGTWLNLLPVSVGIIVGCPLASAEVGSRLGCFSWTQGFSRTHWFIGKISAIVTIIAVTAIGFGALFTWWAGPLYANGMAYQGFALYPPAFFGWMSLGVALGCLSGVWCRRAMPAAALAAVPAVVAAVLNGWYRDHLLPLAVRHASTLAAAADLVNENGYVRDNHVHITEFIFQPLSHFWPLEFADCAVLAVTAGLLLTLTALVLSRQDI